VGVFDDAGGLAVVCAADVAGGLAGVIDWETVALDGTAVALICMNRHSYVRIEPHR